MKRSTFVLSPIIALCVVATGTGALWAYLRRGDVATRVIDAALKNTNAQSAGAIVPRVLGFDQPNTVLFLFLNNTELRPGGGFVGSYGVVTFDHGVPSAMKIGDTQVLDAAAPHTFIVDPPEALKNYLGQTRWLFRDANWSPDFVTSAQRALQFYAAEGGEQANQIHTIIAVTPDVIAQLMKYTGPVTAHGMTFDANNIADLLEYSVEVGYQQKQIPPAERKAIMSDLARALVIRIAEISPTQWGALLNDAFTLLKERHVMLYDIDADVQHTLDTLGWSGRMRAGVPDKLEVVDGNVAALKTDRVMDRAVRYELAQDSNGRWVGTVNVTYTHNGTFDWRTTRYRTYVRVYQPTGTTFLGGEGAMQQDRSKKPGTFSVAEEGGFVSVGAFVAVEPGTTKTITFRFAPSAAVLSALAAHKYGLLVQKQAGLPQFHLTIHHDFGTSIGHASPPESSAFFGDTRYDWQGTLTADQEFHVDW